MHKCDGEIKVIGEIRQGLASILYTECMKCGHKIQLETSDKVVGPQGYCQWESNLAAVWGQMISGGGHAALQETMSVLAEQRGDFHQGIPAITVVVDGGWSKRSHKHSYNAKSGVGVGTGLEKWSIALFRLPWMM